MRLFRALALVSGVGLLAGCNLSSNLPSSFPVGDVSMVDTVINGRSVVSPVAVFFNGVNVALPSSSNVADSCVQANYPQTSPPFVPLGTLYAGDSVTFTTDSGTVQLRPDSTIAANLVYYLLPTDSAIAFTPGSSITVSVPGYPTGYPAANIEAATIPPYTFNAIDTLPDPTNFVITWNSPQGPGTGLVMQLEFTTDTTTDQPDQMIYCSLLDDGSVTIPSLLAAQWRKAVPASRHLDSYKWKTSYKNTGKGGLLVRFQHDVSKSVFP